MTCYEGVEILHMDNQILVAIKPPNLPSQADASGDMDMLTLMKAYVKEVYQKPGAVYLGLVHRLDRPVGGLMAFARTSKAAARLSEQLRSHTMRRVYFAVVSGEPQSAARLSGMLPRKEGPPQHAALSYETVGRKGPLSLLRVELETGRKHQIRIQLARAGLPIWGDARYGHGRPGQQIALWGGMLLLTHPTTRAWMEFAASAPYAYPFTEF